PGREILQLCGLRQGEHQNSRPAAWRKSPQLPQSNAEPSHWRPGSQRLREKPQRLGRNLAAESQGEVNPCGPSPTDAPQASPGKQLLEPGDSELQRLGKVHCDENSHSRTALTLGNPQKRPAYQIQCNAGGVSANLFSIARQVSHQRPF